jgi:hypothetical protein
MTSLREGIRKLRRFPLDRTLDISDVAQFINVNRPISARALVGRLDSSDPTIAAVQGTQTGDGGTGVLGVGPAGVIGRALVGVSRVFSARARLAPV